MKLDTSEWKAFKIGDVFVIHNGKGITKEEIENNPGALTAVQSGEDNNGCIGRINRRYCIDNDYAVFNSPCLTVARSGSAGFVSYQKHGCSVGDSAKILELKNCDTPSDEIFLFLQAILLQIQAKYTYGRKVTQDKYAAEIIRLPATPDGTPDWDFMESYMKTLHYKPLTTKNKPGNAPKLETEKWGNYLLDDFFNIVPGKYHYPSEYDRGTTPYYSASNTNNGISQYISLDPDFEGNCIITGKIGSTAFYAPTPFCATSDVNVFIPKFQMSPFVGLFISGVINFSENYKWAYGRQCRVGNSKKICIKLPSAPDGTPDWQFMEDYIKALPYGDRL